ncbi:MAG: M50 family metallopeptidase [Candidatus Eremiobacteraeota bacterium]|nr:M50 family metallopeptidase [Candidatus Eremiobacteraeota bacterium]
MMHVLGLIDFAQIGKIVTFLIVLSVLVVLHEYGHFILARLNGVRVLEFAVGFGPKIIGRTSRRSGTMYSIRALPLGGYCQMQGEDGKTSEAEQQREFREEAPVTPGAYAADNFQSKSAWRRLAIIIAGPLSNFILCLAILFASAIFFGVQSNNAQPVVGPLVAGMPGARAGLHSGDRIVALGGRPILSGQQLIDTIHGSLNKRLNISYSRGGRTSTVTITPARCPAPMSPKLGCIGFNPIAAYRHASLGEALSSTGNDFVNIASTTIAGVGMLFAHPQRYAGGVHGIVGMGQAATQIQDFGWAPYFFFAAVISFALGLFNLLPVPALDGGRAAFIVAELLRGKPVDPEKEAVVHIAGFAVLLALILIVTFHDITNIVQGKGVF